MNLNRMTGPNDRGHPPEDEWQEMCSAAKFEALDELTKLALIERVISNEQTIEELKYEARYWRLRCVKGAA